LGTQSFVSDNKEKIKSGTREKNELLIRSVKTKSVRCVANWTMNHVKQRVAKDMSVASELVRA
jgi:hypothetical protein